MRQIADELGLNRMTVSSIINGKWRERGYSEETEKKVSAYLRDRGYVQSRDAMKLRNGGSGGSTGILFSSKFYPPIMYAFEKILSHLKLSTQSVEIIAVDPKDNIHGMQELAARRVEKIIWFQSGSFDEQTHNLPQIFPYLKNFKQKIIFNYDFGTDDNNDKELISHGIHLVGINRSHGYAELGKYFKAKGHYKIGFPGQISGLKSRNIFSMPELQTIGIRPKQKALGELENLELLAGEVIHGMERDGITAVYMHDYAKTVNLVNILARKGVDIPEKLLVAGFSFSAFTAYPTRPMVFLNMPIENMIDKTVQLIKHRSGTKYEYCFPLDIIHSD